MEKKKVMILGAGELQVPLIQRAKERNLYVVVVSPDPLQPGVAYADELVAVDVTDKEKILKEAIKREIDGITTDQTDLPVRTAAYVSEKMGLPGIGYETGCLFTDKFLMREKCKELGIPSPKYELTKSIDEAIQAAIEIGFPVIIKPVDSQASHGVAKIENLDELKEKFIDAIMFSKSRAVLIEQWIEGNEFPVDSVAIDGKCRTLAIGQYHPFSQDGIFASYETDWPANQPEMILKLIEDTNQRIVEGFGLRNGRTHGEYIVTENNNCYLVEIGARGGGSFFSSDDVRYVSGFSTEDFLLDFSLGLDYTSEYKETTKYFCCCTLFCFLEENSIVEKVDGIREVLQLPYTRRSNLGKIFVGMETMPIEDKRARYNLVVLASSFEELSERVATIKSMLKISTVDKNGERRPPIWE